MRPGGSPRRRNEPAPGARPTWWVTFALMGVLFSLWSLASPLWSVPDEAAHVINAAAVVRGQVGGQDKMVEVPESYAHSEEGRSPPCYAFHPERTAECAPGLSSSHRPTQAITQFDRYPPVLYAVLGLPSLLPSSAFVVHLMRLVGALVCAALVASGLVSATSLGRGMTVAATLLAVTPMAAFLAGSVNTSGIEMAASVALWPSLLALARHGPGAPGRLIVRTAVAACALASARPNSPMWLAIIVAVVATAAGWERVRALAGDPRVVWAGAVVAAVTAVTVAWVVLRQSLEGIGGIGQRSQGLKADVLFSSGKFPELFREMIGKEGWLDTPPPFLLVSLWTVALGGLLLFGLAAGERRGTLALLATAAMVYVIPIAIEVARAETAGFPWQGRYTMPLAVGVPILAGWLVDTGAASVKPLVRRAARPVIIVACAAQLIAHFWSTRRYVSGARGSMFYFIDPIWHPPLPAWLLLAAFAAVAVALAVWADRLVLAAAGVESGLLGPLISPAPAAGEHGGHSRQGDA